MSNLYNPLTKQLEVKCSVSPSTSYMSTHFPPPTPTPTPTPTQSLI